MARLLNPNEIAVPKGSSHGVLSDAGGKVLAISAQFGWDHSGKFVGDDVASQFRQAIKNVGSVLRSAGGGAEHLLRVNLYITGKEDYFRNIDSIGKDYKAFIGRHVPAMTVVVVKDLLEPGAKVSVEALAVLPEKAGGVEFQRHGQGTMMPDAGPGGRPPPGRPPPGGIKR